MGIHYDYKSTRSMKAMEKQAKREKKLAERKAKRQAKEGIKKKSEINKNILKEISKKSSSLVVIKCKKGHRSNLGRPKPNLSNRMKMFMNYVNK